MNATAYLLPDGEQLLDYKLVEGRPCGFDSVTSTERVTYHGDHSGGKLVDRNGNTIREVKPAAGKPARRRNGSTSSPDSSRWATLNTFVDLIARHLSPVEVAVWLVLFRDCRGGTVEASHRNLASRSGTGLRSVMRAMQRLRAAGLVEVVKASKSKGEASLYRLEARPERCLAKLTPTTGTGATLAPVEGEGATTGPTGTGATLAPDTGANRCQNVR